MNLNRQFLGPHIRRLSQLQRRVFGQQDSGQQDSTLLPAIARTGSSEPALKPESKLRQIFSISIYSGSDLTKLDALPGVRNPVLTRDDVSDRQADFVADPFLVRVDKKWHMFFEVLVREGWRGHIGWASSKDGISWKYHKLVLSEPFHLSYPNVLEWKGDYYMIPESYQAGGVRLYRAGSFPKRWRLAHTLLTGDYLVDPSFFFHDNRWWMFLETSAPSRNDELRLFHAPDLSGPWSEHVCSPIITANPHIARPAGRVQVRDGKVIRFAQDCHPAYGIQVYAFEAEITTRSYREKPLGSGSILGPGPQQWNRCGMHHIDAHLLDNGRYIAAVDGWYEV